MISSIAARCKLLGTCSKDDIRAGPEVHHLLLRLPVGNGRQFRTSLLHLLSITQRRLLLTAVTLAIYLPSKLNRSKARDFVSSHNLGDYAWNALLMVTNFASADSHGWLPSLNGSESACVLIKAGKNRNGCFRNAQIVDHATQPMDSVTKYYSDSDHVFVFDNAPSHMKRDDTLLLACSSVPLKPLKPV
jgi:hypothetical protein